MRKILLFAFLALTMPMAAAAQQVTAGRAANNPFTGHNSFTGIKLEWGSSFAYRENELATHDGVLYQSLADGNTNHEPPDEMYWAQVSGSGGTDLSMGGSSGGRFTIAGPGPWVDIMDPSIGGSFSQTGGNFACADGMNTVTAAGSYDWEEGQGIALPGCGEAPATAAVGGLTTTPINTTGATTYTYSVVGISQNMGYGARSATTQTTTGNATLTFDNYNEICWTPDADYIGYLVYGRTGAVGSLTQLGYVDDYCYDDFGYQSHNILALAPTNPPAAAVNGALQTTITSIAGSTYTVADAASATITCGACSAAVHDNTVITQAVVESLGALGGGKILVPTNTVNNVGPWFYSPVLIDQYKILVHFSPGTTVHTNDHMPLFRIAGPFSYFTIEAYGFTIGSQILSIANVGNCTLCIIRGGDYTGSWGSFYQAGESYNLHIEDAHFSSGGRMIEFGPNSFTSQPLIENNFFQPGTFLCGICHFGNGNQTHNWNTKNNVFDGGNPSEAWIVHGQINAWTAENDVLADFTPSPAVPFMRAHSVPIGGGQVGWVNRYTCKNCDLASGDGDIYKTQAAGTEAFTLDGGQFQAGGSGKVRNGPIKAYTIRGVYSYLPVEDPSTNTDGLTKITNSRALNTGYYTPDATFAANGKFLDGITGGTAVLSGAGCGTLATVQASQVGGDTSGSFASDTTGTCTLTVTPGLTAPNGWTVNVKNDTTTANVATVTSTTTAFTIVVTTVSGDVIKWSAVSY